MDARIRDAALRAAQKTAIVLSLSGATLSCASAHRDASTGEPVDSGAIIIADAALDHRDSGLGDDAAHDRDAGAALDAALDPDAAAADAAGSDAGGCEGLLASLEIADFDHNVWLARFASDEARLSPTTSACCAELLARVDAAGVAQSPEEDARAHACCDVQITQLFEAPLFCTPWGPPCAPEAPV